MITIFKKISITVIVLVAGFLLYQSTLGQLLLSGDVDLIAKHVESYGWKAIILMFLAIFIQAFFPYMPFIILAGVSVLLFGFYFGFIISWIATSLGAIATFLTARYLAREWAEHRVGSSPYFKKFNTFTSNHGFKTILVSRIIAVVPSSLINLAAGISRLKGRSFILATWIGNLWIAFIESLLGHYLIHFEKHSGKLLIILVIVLAIYIVVKRKGNFGKNGD